MPRLTLQRKLGPDSPVDLGTDQALCRTHPDPDMWFRDATFAPSDVRDRELAIAICRTCPIRQACADQAIEARIPYGIWGGLTASERDQLIRDRRSA